MSRSSSCPSGHKFLIKLGINHNSKTLLVFWDVSEAFGLFHPKPETDEEHHEDPKIQLNDLNETLSLDYPFIEAPCLFSAQPSRNNK